jgi:D-Tyr-tRNAtyr deacylase
MQTFCARKRNVALYEVIVVAKRTLQKDAQKGTRPSVHKAHGAPSNSNEE